MSEKSVKKMVCIGTYMKCLKPLYTKIRSKETGHVEFVKYANRIMTLICEEGFAYSKAVTTTRPPNDDRTSHRESSLPTTPRIESRIIQTSAGECLVTESYDVDIPIILTGNMTAVTTPTGSTFIGKYISSHIKSRRIKRQSSCLPHLRCTCSKSYQLQRCSTLL